MPKGGARKGAGRKPAPDKLQVLSLRLPPAVCLWAKQNRDKVRQLIVDAHRGSAKGTE